MMFPWSSKPKFMKFSMGICFLLVLSLTIWLSLYRRNGEEYRLVSTKAMTDEDSHMSESIIADMLKKKVKVVCMIMTMPKQHDTKALAVKHTWATRCNDYFFVSSVTNNSLPSIAAVKREDRSKLWDKTKAAIKHAVKRFPHHDFFLKADDDTFVIVENLRKLLSEHSPDFPLIMGRRFKPYAKQGYLSGGAGYVMSRAALFKIHNGILNKSSDCAGFEHGGAEDVRIGVCAEAVGVKIIDSLDSQGIERFHPFNPLYMMSASAIKDTTWFLKYNYHNITTGMEACSDFSVSFHYVNPDEMYLYHYFLYHLHPYGIHRDYMDIINLRNRS